MKLSKAGWNNVIIFSVMAFILMINVTNQKLFTDDSDSQQHEVAIVGENNVILTMMINQQMTIERNGVSWRVMPEGKLSVQAVDQMMLTWQEAQGEVIAPELDRSKANGIVVSMMIAGQPNIHLYSLYPADELLIVFNHQTAAYIALPPQLYTQLLPPEIFN